MTKSIEIAAMLLGGLSLFAVCFLGFALLSGVPLSDVAVVGRFFEPPGMATAGAGGDDGQPEEDERPARPPRSDERVVEASMGLLSTWSLPAPYSREELEGLVGELKVLRTRLDQREAALDEREAHVDEQLATLAERFETLDTMRRSLEDFEAELSGRALELERDERVADERDAAKWASIASVVAGLEGASRNDFLAQYEPRDAARILRAMDEETAQEVLGGVIQSELPPERARAYVEAYSALAPSGR